MTKRKPHTRFSTPTSGVPSVENPTLRYQHVDTAFLGVLVENEQALSQTDKIDARELHESLARDVLDSLDDLSDPFVDEFALSPATAVRKLQESPTIEVSTVRDGGDLGDAKTAAVDAPPIIAPDDEKTKTIAKPSDQSGQKTSIVDEKTLGTDQLFSLALTDVIDRVTTKELEKQKGESPNFVVAVELLKKLAKQHPPNWDDVRTPELEVTEVTKPEPMDAKMGFFVGVSVLFVMIGIAYFSITTKWVDPVSLLITNGFLGVVVVLALVRLWFDRGFVVAAVLPTITGVALSLFWTVPDVRLFTSENLGDQFIFSALREMVAKESLPIVEQACREMGERGLNFEIVAAINASPEVVRTCIESIRNPLDREMVAGMLANEWRDHLVAGRGRCEAIPEFEYLVEVQHHAIVELTDVAIHATDPISDCAAKRVIEIAGTPDEYALWWESLPQSTGAAKRILRTLSLATPANEKGDLYAFLRTPEIADAQFAMACDLLDEGDEDLIFDIAQILSRSSPGCDARSLSPNHVKGLCGSSTVRLDSTCSAIENQRRASSFEKAKTVVRRGLIRGVSPSMSVEGPGKIQRGGGGAVQSYLRGNFSPSVKGEISRTFARFEPADYKALVAAKRRQSQEFQQVKVNPAALKFMGIKRDPKKIERELKAHKARDHLKKPNHDSRGDDT